MHEDRLIRIAVAQTNPTVGDVAGNAEKLIAQYEQAAAQGASLVVFPEMALVGYPPEDLILVPDFRKQVMQQAQQLARSSSGSTAMLFGCVWEHQHKIYNAALFCSHGEIKSVHAKIMLPNEGIFDEKRLFDAGTETGVVLWDGLRIGILVCEDVWHEPVITSLKQKSIDMGIVINASPFEAGKLKRRHEVVASAAGLMGAPVLYANMTSGQDDIVFDGGSFAVSGKGNVEVQLPEFSDSLHMVEYSGAQQAWQLPASETRPAELPPEQSLWQAMQLGLRDYVHKNGFSTVLLGLSGGIDSALTAALAVDALGASCVKGVLLPSPYTSHESVEDAQELAQALGIETMTIPITVGMEVFEEVLNPVFKDAGWMENPAVGGNLQSRLRGITLMALSNRQGWLLLSTGNKSEIAVGYSTLYGDSCGAYNVLKDLYKTQVYTLARWRNSKGRVIPERSITKAPSAELAPGQKDEDQLPPYDVLDAILTLHIEGMESAGSIIAKGYARDTVEKVVRMVRVNEYKRRQSCPGVKLSTMLFGKDRRFPLTNKF